MLIVAAWPLLSLACDSPTRPDPRIPAPVGTPTSMMFLPCQYDEQVARCRVEAKWGYLYSSTRIVTAEARWSSDAPHLVRVAAPGVLQAVGPGDADLTVSFDGAELTARFRVFADGPPWYVSRGSAYHIRVVDENGVDLEGVFVEIIMGGNAGMEAVSNRSGAAIFRGDIVCGPITARGTKQGYREWVGSATRCGKAGNGSWGSETVGPVRMTPVP